MGIYLVETTTSWKLIQIIEKKSSKFNKKIIYIDDMMIHNLIKYLVKTRLCLWDIKITNFYISQTKSSFEKIFYKVVYHHIIYMYNFLVNLDNFFCSGLHRFSRKLRFPHPTLQGLYFSMACLFRLQDHTIRIVSLYNQSSNACLSLLLTDLVMKFWEKIRRFVPFHVDLWWNTFFFNDETWRGRLEKL